MENQLSALKQLENAGLEPVTLVNGNPTIAFAMSTKKVKIEPWRFLCLPQDTEQEQQRDDSNSNESFIISIPLSQSAVLDLVAEIMPSTPIPGKTEEYFLSETVSLLNGFDPSPEGFDSDEERTSTLWERRSRQVGRGKSSNRSS